MKYTVKRGDTLSQIAQAYGVTMVSIVTANGIKNPNKITVGQVLNIPTETKPSTPPPNYTAIGRQVEKVVEKVEKLPEFQDLLEMMR